MSFVVCDCNDLSVGDAAVEKGLDLIGLEVGSGRLTGDGSGLNTFVAAASLDGFFSTNSVWKL